MNHTPLGTRLVVQSLPKSDNIDGGIILVEDQKEDTRRMRIVSVGPEVREPSLKEGSLVLVSGYAGLPLRGSENTFIIDEGDIFALITGETE